MTETGQPMRPNQIVSLRTALAYLLKGDDTAKRMRLGFILAAMAFPWVAGVATFLIVFFAKAG